MKKKYILFALALIFSVFSTKAVTITIGTGTTSNTTTGYPAPYGNWFQGAKHQFLILASELNAAGMTAGTINSLAFDVAQVNGASLQGFSIGLKHTSASAVSVLETGLTNVFSAATYTQVPGLNNHIFSTPFIWDGISNLLVETCFNNTAWTSNTQTYWSTTTFTSSIWYRADNMTVCSSSIISGTSSQRPNMIFDWTASNTPPVANFSSSSTFTCSGIVSFTDLSTNNPTSWTWYFGDGNTSTQQNPTHTYLLNGTYTVVLEACNAFGCDSLVMNNLITVSTGVSPIAASCNPATLGYCCGFGITNVTFNTINNTSIDGAEGYSDFTCQQTTVFEGASYTLSIGSSAQSTQNYAAWIDFNNDGVFNNTTERVFTATSQMNTSGSVIIPTGATLNTPLRMRVSADYDFSAAPTPCTDLDFGQAEDYTVIITQNLNAPIAAFNFSPNPSCSGTVCFTDQSQNAPTSWAWDFGDGVGTSTQPNPCYNFSTDGVYNVTLIATNTNGSDTITQAVTITTANQVLAPSCMPSTLAYCCGYGILNVNFNTITNPTPDAVEGYQDFSCSKQTTVTEGNNYPINITTGTSNAQDTRVWIDFNNDGIFNATNELVFDAPNAFNPSGNILIPAGAVLNTPLRMRISSDIVGTAQNGCTNNDFGQTEDYGIIIQPNTLPPVANFSGTPTTTCSAPIQFTDLSTNAPTSWLWYFGDGNTSILPNPSHTYANAGVYTVSLVVSNAFGQDSTALINYITIVCPNTMPISGIDTYTACNGTLFDNGGPTASYSNNTDGVVVIQPAGATQITLSFVSFNFENNFDSLIVYDGPTTASPIIGGFTGATIPAPITSSGGSITIRQKTDGSVIRPGFELNWACSNTNDMPISGTVTFTDCSGTLYDNGGPTSNYSDNTDGVAVIQPAGATQVTLNFVSFDFEMFYDSVYVYDGPTTASPIIGAFSGNVVPGSITSSGGSITIRQKSDFTITFSGFELNWTCSNIVYDTVPTTGVNTYTSCSGTLYDDGGPFLNYSNNTEGVAVIQPAGAAQIILSFVSFDMENNFDSLLIYDGPTTASPIIGAFTGNTVPGQVSSSGGSVTIRQKTGGSVDGPGFELNWNCNLVGISEFNNGSDDYVVYPNPTSNIINIKSTTENNLNITEILLINTMGQVVIQKQLKSTNNFLQINVEHLPKGIYFLNIRTNKDAVIKKINIQ